MAVTILRHSFEGSLRSGTQITGIPAAFAALIANDLCNPQAMAAGFSWVWAAPLIAAIPVAFVGVKTKSMAWCIVAGVGVLAFLMLASGQM